MQAPKPGDHVRVTYTGVIDRAGDGTPRYLHVVRPDGSKVSERWPLREGVMIDIIEPEYADKGVYIDADGDVFKYHADDRSWTSYEHGRPASRRGFDYPTRPLLRIDG